jgi:ribonuclease HI
MEFCSRDITTVKLHSKAGGADNRAITISSVYLPYDDAQPPPTRELASMVDQHSVSGGHLLVGCDSNAHSTEWGSTGTNRRGEFLLRFLLSNNLHILNIGNHPTFKNKIREEVIDISFCTEGLISVIEGWCVSDEPSLSDHNYILFQIGGVTVQTEQYRNPRKTDWASFVDSLTVRLRKPPKITSCIQLDQAAFELQDIMLDCYYSSCPLSTRSRTRRVRWWSQDLAVKRRTVRRLFNRAKRTMDWQEYHGALTDYGNAVRKAKLDSWRAFCSEIESSSKAARLHKVMAQDPINPVGTLSKPTGGFTATAEETLNLLLESHFPGCLFSDGMLAGPDPPAHSPWPRASREDWTLARRVVTVANTKWAINKFKPFKSPGGDGIFPALLQKGPETLYPILCDLFRASLALGYVPQPWRVSRVVFIPKRGRASYSDPRAFRPISLSSFLLKTLERLVEHHIRRGVLQGNPLHRKQHAYQSGKSVESALHQLVSRIEDALDRKEIALAAFLDIEGAFDRVAYESMVRAARNRGIKPTCCRWIDHMLRSRKIQSTILNVTQEITATRGCPQGGVLSPLLWSLVVDSLLVTLDQGPYHVQGYADDIALVVQGKFPETLTDIMNEGLRLINEWCNWEGLCVNPSKTVIVPFTRMRKGLGAFSNLRLDHEPVSTSESVKYLGVTLDKKLTWNVHFSNTLRRARWSLMISRRSVGVSWGFKPHISHWLYVAVIRPQITYASLVWWQKAQQTTAAKELTSLQRLACLCTTGAFSSTPSAALEILLGLLPLSLFISMEARLAAYRLKITDNWRGSLRGVGHSLITEQFMKNSVLDMRPDFMATEYLFTRSYSVTLGTRADWYGNYDPEQFKSWMVWYTDGSKIGTDTGFGAYRKEPRTCIAGSLGVHCTIFQAEVFAILTCAQRCLEECLINRHILILSDSQAALNALTGCQVSSKLVWDCTLTLIQLSANNHVMLKWVPGHRGIEGNEKADQLAKEGAVRPFYGPEPVCGISRATARDAAKKWAREEHQKQWQLIPGQRHSKRLIKNSSQALTRSLLLLGRKEIRLAVAFLTGHGHFRKHLQTVQLLDGAPACRLCGQFDETATHIIFECEALGVRRRRLFGTSEIDSSRFPKIVKLLLELVRGSSWCRQD